MWNVRIAHLWISQQVMNGQFHTVSSSVNKTLEILADFKSP